ncbi:Uncharacterised protein [Vibrio cholerae]|nr:Uncharacterised protein [Vibrio cholerae]
MNCVLKMPLKRVTKFKPFAAYKSSSLCRTTVWKTWMCSVLHKKMALLASIF